MSPALKYIPPRAPDRFAIVPIYADSTGCEHVPQDAIMHGSMHTVMRHIRSSKARQEDIAILNEADQVRREKAALKAERAELQAYADSVAADRATVTHKLVQDFSRKLDALTHRIDAIEAQRAYDPDPNERPSPTGYPDDDGELESPKAAPSETPDLPRSSIEDD